MSCERIYLDNNATTQILPEAAETMAVTWQTAFANPGSQHSFGRDARPVLDRCRDSVADILGADPSEVIFTSGGTESINAAVYGLTLGRRGVIALTSGEHPRKSGTRSITCCAQKRVTCFCRVSGSSCRIWDSLIPFCVAHM